MRAFFGLLAAAAVLAAFPAAATESGYLKITGAKQGVIKGEVTKPAWADSLEVVNLDWGMSVPTSQGMAIGRRVQQPVVFTVRWSKATPLLLTAAEINENLTSVVYCGLVAQPDGTTKQNHTLSLTNAHISAIKIMDHNGDDNLVDPLVEVTMSYQKLTLTESDGGITAEDNWLSAQ